MNIYKVAATIELSPRVKDIYSKFLDYLIQTNKNPSEVFNSDVAPALSAIFNSVFESLDDLAEDPEEEDLLEMLSDEVANQTAGDRILGTVLLALIKEYGPEKFMSTSRNFDSFLESLRLVTSSYGAKPSTTQPVEQVPETEAPATSELEEKEDLEDALPYREKIVESERLPFTNRINFIIEEFSPPELKQYLLSLKFDRQSEFGETYPKREQIVKMVDLAERHIQDYIENEDLIAKRQLTMILGKLFIYSFGKSVVSANNIEEYVEKEKEEVAVETATKPSPPRDPQNLVEEEEELEEVSDEEKNAEKEIAINNSTFTSSEAFKNTDLFNQRSQERVAAQKLSGFFKSPFIDFYNGQITSLEELESMDLPQLDQAVLDNFVSASSFKIRRLYDVAKTSAQSNASIIRDLNNLVYTIKVADLETYESIIAYENKISQFSDSEAKSKQIARIDKIKNLFINNCMSSVIFQDQGAILEAPGVEIISDLLFYITLVTSSPLAASIVLAHKLNSENLGIDIEKKLKKILNKKNYSVRDEDLTDIAINCAEEANSAFKNRAIKFFKLDYSVNISNFISQVNLRFDFTLNQALQRVYVIKSDYELSPCPVCFKLIPTSFSSETKQADKGFTVCVVSPFKENKKTKELMPITEDELNAGGRKFKISKTYNEKFFSSEDEFFYLKKLVEDDQRTGGSTWNQVQSLLSSSIISHQREGWHRRASAFLELGAKEISSFRKITDIVVQCPAKPVLQSSGNDTRSEGSYCGLKVTPIQSSSLSSRLSYQTQFSGKARSIKEDDRPANTPDPTGWSENTYQAAQNSVRAGFKFSAVSFACPCRIKNPDSSAALMHRNVVISKNGPAGSPGFIPPTKPDGSLDNEIQPGTLAFMVCSAPTSLSSFNKNEEDGEKYILETLLSTAQASVQDYYKFLNYLVYNGLDPQDIMAIDADVRKYAKEKEVKSEQVKTSVLHPGSTSRQRMQKISSLMVLAAKKIQPPKGLGITDSVLFEKTFGNLYLVCPFGHKFKIGDSLRFGSAYSALYSTSAATKYSKLILSEGEENAREVANSEILKARPRGFSENAWDSDKTYDSSLSVQKRIITGKLSIVDVSKKQNKKGRVTSGGYENIASSEIGEEDAAVARLDGNSGLVTEGRQLPGTEFFQGKNIDYRVTDKNAKANFVRVTGPKFNRLTEIIKKTILVVETYTSGIISDSNALINALNSGTLTYDDVNSNLKNNYTQSLATVLSDPAFSKVKEYNLSNKFIETLIDQVSNEMLRVTSYLMSAVAETGGRGLVAGENMPNLDRSISVKILSAAIGNAITSGEEVVPDEELSFNDLIDPGSEDFDAFIERISASIISQNNFINYIVRDSLFKAKQGYEHAFGSRLVAVSYAIGCAKLLSSLYSTFFNPDDQYNYLGFDLGVDLSMYSSLIKTGGDISIYDLSSRIPSSIDGVLVRQASSVFPRKYINADSYPMRMDKFYSELSIGLERVKSSASSPNSLLAAKKYIDDRIISEFGSDKKRAEEMMKKLSSFVPFVTTRLVSDHNNDDPESFSYRRSPTRERIPYYTDTYNFEDNFRIVAAYVIAPVSRKPGITKIRPRLLKLTANTAQEAEVALEQGRKKLDDLFSNLGDNPEFAESVKKLNFARQDCDYQILRDDYIVSKSKKPQVARIKVGSNTVSPERFVDAIAEFSGTISPGTNIVFEVINVTNRLFSIAHKESSGQVVPMNISKIEYGSICNSYFVTASSPSPISSPRFEVSIPLSSAGEIPSFTNNFNNSKVQIGNTKGKIKDQTAWPELPGPGEDWSHIWAQRYKTDKLGFTNRWSYIGIVLPIPDTSYKTNKPNVNKGKDVPVLDYKFVVNFEGNKLDITPLFLRGRQDFFEGEKEQVARIEAERKKAERDGAEKPRQILPGDIGKLKELEDQIIGLKESIEDEIDPEKASIMMKKLDTLIEQVKSFDIRFDTTPSFIHFDPQQGFPKPSNGQYFAAADAYPTLAPYLVNPYHAFRIIRHPEIAGAKIDDVDKERLRKFVTKIYNLQPIIDYLYLTFDVQVTGEDLFDDVKLSAINEKIVAKNPKLKAKGIIGIINSFIKDKNWLNESGEYFDIISAPKNSEDGSYIQFILDASSTTEPELCPAINNFTNAGERTTEEAAMFRRSGRSKLRGISSTIYDNTLEYIRNVRVKPEKRVIMEEDEEGIEEDENDALDPLSNYSKDSKKNVLRRSKLKGMINHVEDMAQAKELLLRGIP